MPDDADFQAMLEAALRPSPSPSTVELDTEQGREILLYSDGDDGQVRDGGTLFIPADTLENRRRASITSHCPLCPDVNQGMSVRDIDLGPEAGTYASATYSECGHAAAVRLDEEGQLYLLVGGQLLLFTPPEH
jgi:hypothetical protein